MTHRYEIRIDGRVGDALLEAFGDLTVTTRDAQTVVAGPLPDQAALLGLLVRIQGLGLEVVDVHRTDLHRTDVHRTTDASPP